MKVEYEVFYGKPTNLKPMPLSEVVKLKKGDKVYVWWAKDGNLEDVRVDEICTVDDIRVRPAPYPGTDLSVAGGDIRISREEVERCPDSNQTDWASRGSVFFYYPPED